MINIQGVQNYPNMASLNIVSSDKVKVTSFSFMQAVRIFFMVLYLPINGDTKLTLFCSGFSCFPIFLKTPHDVSTTINTPRLLCNY